MNISFLLGSGASIPAGMPSTKTITNEIFCKKSKLNSQIINFLEIIRDKIEEYYKNRIDGESHIKNYEEIYYVIDQLYNNEIGEIENAVIEPFRKIIENEIVDSNPLKISRDAIEYIERKVWNILSTKPESLDHLTFLFDCINSTNDNINIFTLNHDTNIEELLKRNEIVFVDGFEDRNEKIRFWNPVRFETRYIKLYKLHGSVDWFRFDINSTGERFIGQTSEQDVFHIEMKDGYMPFPYRMLPLILIGTFNKQQRYTSDIFRILFCHFVRELLFCNNLIISGYGFGDKGINNVIFNWIHEGDDKRIILIHPNKSELLERARGVLNIQWDDLQRRKKLLLLEKGIEKTTWDEISKLIR